MAKQSTAGRGTTEPAVQPDVSDDERAPWETDVTPVPAEASQLATMDDATDDAIVPELVSMRRAADFARQRGYQAATLSLVQYLASNAVDTMDLNVVILEQMANRIMNATSPDDILDPFGTVKGNSLFGKPLNVIGVQFLESDQVDGFPWYVALQVQDAQTGQITPVTVGGEKLVLQAAGLDMHGAWPLVISIHQSTKATKAGFYPLELRWAHKS